MVTELP
jgi:group II intron reverse transcriptase/maturase